MRRILTLFFIFFIFIEIHAQQAKKSILIEELIENIAAEADEEIDYTELIENLNYYTENPLDLNTAEYSDFEKMQFLSDFEIHNLMAYRKQNGQFLSVYELQLVEKLSAKSIEYLSYFVTIESIKQKENYPILKSLKFGKNQLFLRNEFYLENSEAYAEIDSAEYAEKPNSRYLGNKMKYYLRYKYNYKNRVLWGITAEKDPGEIFGTDYNAKGFDYYSAHLQLKDFGKLKNLAVGDYQLKFGQGLVLWSGMATKKSVYTLNVNRRERGIQKYSSVDENIFMRGIATTIDLGQFQLSGFYSRKYIDANIADLDTIDDEVREVSSFQITGFHRTPSELTDKDAISETVMGGNITWLQEFYKIGLTFAKYSFSSELKKQDRAYNIFEFRGSENTNLGLNYRIQYSKYSFFGETAMSENGGIATLNGGVFNLAPQFSVSVLQRYFKPHYQAYYSNAFGETGKTYNESGLYIGTEIHPYKNISLSAYFDAYKFMWLRSRVSSPSGGNEYFVQLDYSPKRDFNMYFRFKREKKLENLSLDYNVAKQTEISDKIQFRYHLSYDVNQFLNLKTRFEVSSYTDGFNPVKYGFLIYQDVNYLFSTIPLKVNFRYAVFDTDDYDTRIYAYENDVLYGYSIPAYYSKGSRIYFTLKYAVFKNLDFWFRVAQTYYSDKNTIGSGIDEINDNKKTQIKFQLRFTF